MHESAPHSGSPTTSSARPVASATGDELVVLGSARAVQNVLEVAAGLAVLHGDWARAVRYFGAGEAQLAQMAIKRTPEDNAVLMRNIAKARDALGEPAFVALESAGRALSYDDAIEDARAWLERTA